MMIEYRQNIHQSIQHGMQRGQRGGSEEPHFRTDGQKIFELSHSGRVSDQIFSLELMYSARTKNCHLDV